MCGRYYHGEIPSRPTTALPFPPWYAHIFLTALDVRAYTHKFGAHCVFPPRLCLCVLLTVLARSGQDEALANKPGNGGVAVSIDGGEASVSLARVHAYAVDSAPPVYVIPRAYTTSQKSNQLITI